MELFQSDFSNPFRHISQPYNQYRPSYPKGFFLQLREEVTSTDASDNVVADIGCGTGISTRQIAEAFDGSGTILGIDASPEMLEVARAQQPELDHVNYLEGRGEDIPCQDGTIALVTACQAAQWFDRPRFYAECRRALRSQGLLAIVQNNRAYAKSHFLLAYEELLENTSPGYSRAYRSIDFVAEVTCTPDFGWHMTYNCHWRRAMTEDEFIAMSLTSSKVQAAVKQFGEAYITDQVANLWSKHISSEQGEIPYESEMFIFRRGYR